jgi:hypothetical protein
MFRRDARDSENCEIGNAVRWARPANFGLISHMHTQFLAMPSRGRSTRKMPPQVREK